MFVWHLLRAVFLGMLAVGLLQAESEEPNLSLVKFDHASFNESQPIVFEGKLTAKTGNPIQNATIHILSDGSVHKMESSQAARQTNMEGIGFTH